MRLTAKIKLQPTPEQHSAFQHTLEQCNRAAQYVSNYAWEQRQFLRVPLHHAMYYVLREQFDLSAQMAVRALGKVADAYKLDRKTKREFGLHGAFPYDDRILRYLVADHMVSITTLTGRIKVPFLAGKRQLELLARQKGESDLCLIDGDFYLFATCDVDEPAPSDVEEYLGVDLGIKNIATDSDGAVYSSGHLNGLRHRHAKLRQRLQKKGTRSSRRLLRKRRRKETRFANDVNHCISKSLVATAKGTGRGIALEDLTGIRSRTTVRKSQRRQHHSWAFSDLRAKIEYKAALAGVPVVLVDPRNTSRMCQVCGCVDKANRRSQESFLCVSCGFASNADHNAAVNIGRGAVVNQPNVSEATSQTSSRALSGTSRLL